MKEVTTIGIDLAKRVFQLHGADKRGKCLFRKRLSRKKLLPFLAKQVPCRVAMEACGGAHWWATQIRAFGHDARLIAPQHVKPYVKSNKNDYNDAEAICEAATRPTMRFVEIKSADQLSQQGLHRVREQIKGERTAIVNQIHGLMLEFGVVMPKGGKLTEKVAQLLGQPGELPELMQTLLSELYEQYMHQQQRLKDYDQKVKQHTRSDPRCQVLMQRDGIGELTASAAVAILGNAAQYKNGRSCSAGLGLVPRQYSSGNKYKLGSITKRGDSYLRQLLIHGARAVIRHVDKRDDVLGRWLKQLIARRGKNRAAVALANKNARWIWNALQGQQSVAVA